MNRLIQLVVIANVCAAGALSAQNCLNRPNPLESTVHFTKVLVGPVVGGSRDYHTGGFRTVNDPICPVFSQGTGWGPLAGISAEFVMGEAWSLISRICYDNRPGNFRQYLPDAGVLVVNQPDPVKQTVSTESVIGYRMLTAEMMYKQDLARIGKSIRLSVAAGPVLGYVLGGTNRQVMNLEQPQNARFINLENKPVENGGRTLVFYDGAIPGRNTVRLSLKCGVQTEFGMYNNQVIVTPGMYFDYGLTRVSSAENWNLNALLFHVDFRRAF